MKTYRNAERTKKWIRQAFTELMAEKRTIRKITVNELCERADITKTTFYYHYSDVYAVAEEFENELIATLAETLNEIEKDPQTDYAGYIRQVLEFLKAHEEAYKLVINASDLNYFVDKLKNIFAKRITNTAALIAYGFSDSYEKRAVQVYFLTGACVDVVVQYFKGNITASLDVIGETVIEAIDKLQGK